MGVWWPFTPVGVLNDAAVAVNATTPTEGECPIVCVRGLGLQVVRESVGVSHG
ncbi:hypothetical protein FRC0426_02301 [Corynebacterium diphtheriae]|nr:hypothetical protein FRC0426_02301 [Corynebacterium diphtheriae]